ncbi:MAG: glucan biosynthesis glucosyltransferase H [Chromatiales bacterium 21-64-14]|nr:MAG: glucan biosynthesis glucosyltransferase H [Chromatiales bacterium 21-64-14]HQU14777.1 glucans biosynthesis glucosyltransferase MdoH [Gammaproteobacteria bacterium]
MRECPTRRPVAPLAWSRAAWFRRTLLTTLVLVQMVIGSYFMLTVLPYHGDGPVEKALAVLFGILFGWISAGFWTAVFGFVVRRMGGDRYSLLRRHTAPELDAAPLARCAIVMPIYHEPVERSLGGLRAVYQSLARTGKLESFEFFILSDSRDPDVWLAEQAAWYRLCRELNAFGRIHYRRRRVNTRHKTGNIDDFLRRWGRHYEYMVVLDADSLVRGDTLVRMVQLMELEPQVGILQTGPEIVNARSVFARVQQFSNALYGPLFTVGLAAIQLGEAAYWGHNAIVRVQPFMRYCGLRRLPAAGLFGGPILSHDFVEAAYMRRAGYEVWLEPGLEGSYEESPPSLGDDLVRDRRWAKGNLQHLWLLVCGRDIRFAHRMTFVNGILSYLASPLWLAFLVLAAVETTRLTLWPINYFPSAHALFPLWPQWHPEWAIRLAGSTAFLLFFPKVLAVADAILAGRYRGFGGLGRLHLGVLLEMLISTLLAPIRMLAHTRFVLEALSNVSTRWAGQNRSAETRWAAALISHAPGTVVAAAWATFAYWLKPLYFFWSLPVALPLVLAAPTSVLLSRGALGDWLRRRHLLTVAQETVAPDPLAELDGPPLLPIRAPGLRPFEEAVIDPDLNAIHAALARGRRGSDPDPDPDLARLRACCLNAGPRVLTRQERDRLAQDGPSLTWLHQAVWCAAPQSYWGRLLDRCTTRVG